MKQKDQSIQEYVNLIQNQTSQAILLGDGCTGSKTAQKNKEMFI
jgi:hypothetical protein